MRVNNIFTSFILGIALLINPINFLSATEQRLDIAVQQLTTRASIDVGSGATKITVADVNPITNKIVKIWHQTATKVELSKDLANNADGCLSQKVEYQLIDALKAMQQEAGQFDPQEYVAVGTSVFRTAQNSLKFLDNVEAATGIKIHVIPQIEEGKIGFATAVAVSNEDPENILSWDSGAGSFQISTLIQDEIEMYGAEFAFVPALMALFANRDQPFSLELSPNPVNQVEALELIETIRSKLPPLSDWIAENNKKIIAICPIAKKIEMISGHATFTKEEVMKAIFELCGKNDEQLMQYLKSKHVVVELILLYAVMDHCGFEQVTYNDANGICEGLLVTPHFWQ